jgi:hypothetical protein
MSTAIGLPLERDFPTMPARSRAAVSPEAAEFAREAKEVLDGAGKDIAAAPREPGAAVRKRAATRPPITPTRRPPSMPPLDKATLAGQPTRFSPTVPGAPGSALARKPKAEIIDDEASTTSPRLERPVTGPDTLDEPAPATTADPPEGWRNGLAARIDAVIDDDFGTDTPVQAPTRAELQALSGTPPDATRQQSFEELERLRREAIERPSDPEILFTRRPSHPTAEIEENDIEAAIELAPPARRTALGVAKKKPTE